MKSASDVVGVEMVVVVVVLELGEPKAGGSPGWTTRREGLDTSSLMRGVYERARLLNSLAARN
jgi:hypothetical protein